MNKPSLSWASLVEIAGCPTLPPDAKEFAIAELRRLAAYLDDAIFFDWLTLHVEPFAIGNLTRRTRVTGATHDAHQENGEAPA